jgi:Prion-inhibition and propagation/Protein tyrosine and serine/threonine kinase
MARTELNSNKKHWSKGYGYFEVAVDMPERYASLRLRLQIEFGRLLDWGDAAGLTENDVFDKRMKVNGLVVMAVLGEMRSLLKNMRQLSLNYENAREPTPDSAKMPHRRQPVDTVNLKEFRAMFESADVQKERRKFPKGFNRLIEFASGVKVVGKEPFKRVRWALRDEEKLKEMLQRLTQLTNCLHETLGDNKMNILLENTRDSCLAVLQLTKDVGQIKALLEATRMVPVSLPGAEGDDSMSIFSQAETLVEVEVEDRDVDGPITQATSDNGTIFQRLVEFRAVNTQLYASQNGVPIRVPIIHSHELSNLDDTDQDSRVMAQWGHKTVWIDWKPYEIELTDTPDCPHGERIPESVQRNAERLVALLRAKEKPAEFCVPFCLGYVTDAAKKMFGFMYEAPIANVKPKSLLQLLSGRPAPIKRRVALAQRLATCMLYLHAVNWLHKSLRSASILFFSETEPDIRRPFLANFEYSRPDENNETFTGAPVAIEWALYCHPDYIGRPDFFRKSYDIYSLGIILLEIAFWKRAEEIFRSEDSLDQERRVVHSSTKDRDQFLDEASHANKIRERMRANRDRLLRDKEANGKPGLLKQVRDSMGDRYHNAVRACIGGMEYFRLPTNVDQTDPVIATLFQQAYLRLVVDVLHGIVV